MGEGRLSFALLCNSLALFILSAAVLSQPVSGDLRNGNPQNDDFCDDVLPLSRNLLQDGTGGEPMTVENSAVVRKIVLNPQRCEGPKCSALAKAALILYPGGFLNPENYLILANALQIKASTSMELWIYIVPIDWPNEVNNFPTFGAPPLDGIVRDLESDGFEAIATTIGNATRYENVFLAAHSAGGTPLLQEFPSAGGIILIGTEISPTPGRVSSLAQFPIPVLMIVGELDGLFKTARVAFSSAEMMEVALRMGLRYALKWKTVAVVKGMNHIQFTNATARLDIGDIEQEISVEEAADRVADLMAAFVAINMGQPDDNDVEQHVSALEAGVQDTVSTLSPYVSSMGYGNLTEAYGVLKQAERYEGSILPGGLLRFGVWGEIIGDDPNARSQIVHPGEAAAAEGLCVKAQQKLMPIVDGLDVNVAASIHTSLPFFQYSTPSIEEARTGTLRQQGSEIDRLVSPPCLIYRPQLIRRARGSALSPQYWMKMAPCDAAVSTDSGVSSCPTTNFSAVDFNREVFDTALNLSTADARNRFEQRGRPIEFVDKMMCDGKPCTDLDPMEWASSKYGITFDVFRNNGTLLVVELVSLVTEEPAVVHFKSLSVARAVEYIMIDSLQAARN